MQAREHNRLLGILFLVWGGLQLLGLVFSAIIMPVIFSGIPEFASSEFSGMFWGIMIFALALSALFAIPPFLAGYGMLKRKSWSRMAALVAGAIALLSIPMGTALGIYTFWFTLSEPGKHFYLYGSEQTPLPPPPPESWRQG
ncbi:MAG TPA: hypothetical protein VGB17_07250 [Pyrinomonadaceae bacterium]|jgi:hypothetical protein